MYCAHIWLERKKDEKWTERCRRVEETLKDGIIRRIKQKWSCRDIQKNNRRPR